MCDVSSTNFCPGGMPIGTPLGSIVEYPGYSGKESQHILSLQ
jgi:hypothetical protein